MNLANTGNRAFAHGHTYQGHPIACAAALEVQRIIREDNLVENVRKNGLVLEELLYRKLGDHPNVGNIRGKGFFWGVSAFLGDCYPELTICKIEFVQDKTSKQPFPPSAGIADAVHTEGLMNSGIMLYPGTGTKDGVDGDHVLVSPVYQTTKEQLADIVDKIGETVYRAFKKW